MANVGAPDAGSTQILRRPEVLRTMKSATFAPEGAPQSWLELPVFRGLPADVLQRLLSALVPAELATGDVLMYQGLEGHSLFVVERGHLRIEVRAPDGSRFERELKAPAIVGEMALITRDPRSATVTAMTPCRMLRMDRPVFEDLCREYPQTAVFLTALVGDRLIENRGIRKVGKYEVVGRLGSGGVATVFEANHPGLGTTVALKMLSHTLVLDPSHAEHFDREARLVAQLAHEHIVRVLDTEEAYGTRFIVMEKLSGELLEHAISRGDRLPWSEVRRILAEIADALAYSHARGLIHRDIKAANVFMTEDKSVKLLDFGIAVQVGTTVDEDGRIIGTPFYMAPEQILGHDLDGRVDLYSLGILAYELCTHELPFPGPSVHEVFSQHLTQPLPDPRLLDPDIPEDLIEFMQIATAKQPAQRFAGCAEAAEFLLRTRGSVQVDPQELSSLSVTYLPSRRVQVQEIMRETAERLARLRGVHVFAAHQHGHAPDVERPTAPGETKRPTQH